MGTTIRNIHVYTEKYPVTDLHEEIVHSIQSFMKLEEFEVVSVEESSLSIRVVSNSDTPWISVYQTDPLRDLSNLAPELSRTSKGLPVIEINVYDSDVLEMQLSHNGKVADTFNDWENYGELPRQIIGNAQIWHNILSTINSSEILQEAWSHQSSDSPFVSEGVMYRVIELLNIDKWRLWAERTLDNIPSTAYISELHFRYSHPLPYEDKATGLPRLIMNSYSTIAQTTLGKNHDIFFSVMNHGGSGEGIQIDLHGSALDNELVEPIGIITNPPFNSIIGEIVATPEIQYTADDTKTFQFILDDHTIPAGIADWRAVQALPSHLRDIIRESELQHEGGTFTVVFKPLKMGKGQLITRVIPIVNPQAHGEFKTDFDVNMRLMNRYLF